MNAAMVHRGPDDEGVHIDPSTGSALGARRLSIIDVAGGHQPLSNEDGSIWAVLNGEIYNHPELQERLENRGHKLRSRSDTEVLVHLYEDLGDDLVHALEGMFAFAIWDARRKRMLVARDRFGEKPLFYTEANDALVLASELSALRRGLQPDPELNAQAVDSYFLFGYVPGPMTMARGIHQLPPGHLMVWDSERRLARQRRYWRPPLFDAEDFTSHMDVVAETEALLERSVASRMLSDVPLGIFLSGGLDSALLATMAARLSSGPVKTFTVGYDVGAVNETDTARNIAKAIGSDHREVILSGEHVAQRAQTVLSALDQPVADQALIALNAVAEAAREEITVAVGGEGADELYAGYPRYRWLAKAETIRGLIPQPVASATAGAFGSSSARAHRVADVLSPKPTLTRHIDWVTANRRALRSSVYGPAMRSRHLDAPETGVAPLMPWNVRVEAAFMGLDQQHWLPYDVLVKADRASMLASLEMRTPYLHHELAELAATIPLRVHTRKRGKHILREVLARTGLPFEHRAPKQAFRVPLSNWLRTSVAGTFSEQLATSSAYSEGWFDRGAVKQLFEAHRAGKADHSQVLWPVFAFACWLDGWRAG